MALWRHSMSARDQILALQRRMGESIIGQAHHRAPLLTLLANGNVLMEGLPGLAKTRAIKSLAANLSPHSAASSSPRTCCRLT